MHRLPAQWRPLVLSLPKGKNADLGVRRRKIRFLTEAATPGPASS